ncbi:XRE family transcriptional regulator, partial [Leptospira noguchii]|uniref:XRE family transcriptional regulator n=1 Tax=Leptospira noguchii TaxID=28182 RepID=UPI000ABF5593
KKETIKQIIEHRRKCVDSEQEHREALTEYIREFVEQKRGNTVLLSQQTGIQVSRISNLVNNSGRPPGMDVLLKLAEEILNLNFV